jgi:hypothetical protein
VDACQEAVGTLSPEVMAKLETEYDAIRDGEQQTQARARTAMTRFIEEEA